MSSHPPSEKEIKDGVELVARLDAEWKKGNKTSPEDAAALTLMLYRMAGRPVQ